MLAMASGYEIKSKAWVGSRVDSGITSATLMQLTKERLFIKPKLT
jgi:hypothetical protein